MRGYKEEGTITTAFDMTVLNDMDRFHLVMDAIDRLPQTGSRGSYLKQQLQDKLVEHKRYIIATARTCRRCAIGCGRRGSAAPERTESCGHPGAPGQFAPRLSYKPMCRLPTANRPAAGQAARRRKPNVLNGCRPTPMSRRARTGRLRQKCPSDTFLIATPARPAILRLALSARGATWGDGAGA